MAWEVEFTDEFGKWWDTLTEKQQDTIDRLVEILEAQGPLLKEPYSKRIESSRHFPSMKELRAKQEDYIRVFYAFDPQRTAILLIGGGKAGRWEEFYDEYIPLADKLYDVHLQTIQNEQEGT